MLANRLPANVHLIVASRDRFLPAAETVRLGGKGLSNRHGAAAPEPYGACRLCPSLRHGAFRSAGRKSALFQRGLVLRRVSEPAHALRARRAAQTAIPISMRLFTAAMIDPLPERQREFLAVMGLADEFTVEMAQCITANADAAALLCRADGAERLCHAPAGRRDLSASTT